MTARATSAADVPLGPLTKLLALAVVAMTTLVNLPRLTPVRNGDFFSFVSVAERIGAGDRLYEGVWDNKDPYFYYALSLVGDLGGWGYFVLELLWVALVIFGLDQLGRSQGMPSRWSLTVAWGVAPWCLLGVNYSGTMTTMPGVALVIGVLALAARGRWTGVGILLGVLVLLKLILVPVAVAGAVVFCTDRRAQAYLATAAGGALSTAAGLAVLAFRGELAPYVSMLSRNTEYAGRMTDSGGLSGFVKHLGLALPASDYPGERIALCALIVGIVLAWVRTRPVSRLLLCAVVVTVSSIMVLGLTAIWPHHAQLLAVPACLTLLALCETGPPRETARLVALMPVLLFAAYSMGGATPAGQVAMRPETAAEPYSHVGDKSPEAASITAEGSLDTYSRLGRNDITAHASGLDRLSLGCRDFQQYPFDPRSTFSRTLRCLPQNDVVFVARNFAGQSGFVDYDRFVIAAQAVLDREFTCTVTGYGQKCLRDDR